MNNKNIVDLLDSDDEYSVDNNILNKTIENNIPIINSSGQITKQIVTTKLEINKLNQIHNQLIVDIDIKKKELEGMNNTNESQQSQRKLEEYIISLNVQKQQLEITVISLNNQTKILSNNKQQLQESVNLINDQIKSLNVQKQQLQDSITILNTQKQQLQDFILATNIQKQKQVVNVREQGNNLSVSENYGLVGVSNTNGTQESNNTPNEQVINIKEQELVGVSNMNETQKHISHFINRAKFYRVSRSH